MAKLKQHPDQGLAAETQSSRFIEAARELGTDEDPEHFKEIVRKLASAPVTRNGPSKAKKPRIE